MINNRLLFLCLILFLFACTENYKVKSKAPIPEDKMVGLTLDLYYLDAHFDVLHYSVKDSIVAIKFKDILAKYDVTEAEFKKAQEYYSQNEKANKKLEQELIKLLGTVY